MGTYIGATINQLRGIAITSDQTLYLWGSVGLRIDDTALSQG